MSKLNVTQGDSRDEKERKRFFPFTPQDHLLPSIEFKIPNRLALHYSHSLSFQGLARKTGSMKISPNGRR